MISWASAWVSFGVIRMVVHLYFYLKIDGVFPPPGRPGASSSKDGAPEYDHRSLR